MKVAVFIMLSVLRIPSHSRWVFLGLGVAFLKYQGDKLITQFDLKLGNISGEEVLNMGKAFDEFIPEIIDETTIMVCYPLVLLLIYPLGPFYKIIFMLKLIFGLLYYIPPLVAKASMVEVNCGFLNLPLFWFITFLALVLSLVIHFLVLLLIYLDYRFIRVQRDKELNSRMPCKIFPCKAM
ncbi:hypothetical protein Fmac_021652 [Flemingia macrophylla]|uniref:Uncharacterized protein n=1 Tax=Flemingia macrophylla TaxID=520843 RepID=A0ABD1LXI9_9FABA